MKLVSVKIKIGDLFKKLDIDNKVYETTQHSNIDIFIPTPDGDFTKILGYVKKEKNNILKIELEDRTFFKCSENHLIQNEEGLTKKVKYANSLYTINGIKKILSKVDDGIRDVYDISIAEPHLYVTPNGIIHHNTFLALEALKSAQERGYFGIIYDSEMANNDKSALKARGVDIERLLFIPIDTVENLKTSVLNIIEEVGEDDRIFIMIDSIGNLSTNKEIEDSTDGATTKDMSRAAQLKSFFRTVTLRAGIKNIPIIAINHTYAIIGGFMSGGQQIAGGSGGLYNASIIAEFTKAQEKGKDGRMSGALVSSTVSKCRTAKEKTKTKFTIDFDTGLTKTSGLELFCFDEKLITKVGRSWVFAEQTGYKQAIGKDGKQEKFVKISDEMWEEFLVLYLGAYMHKKFAYQSVSESLGIDESEVEEETE